MSLLIATEDVLSEAVARRLAKEARFDLAACAFAGRQGFGYLRKRIAEFARAARRRPVLVLTDLDAAVCAPALLANWSEGWVAPELLLLRVAVREVEAWLLADRRNFAAFLGVSERRIEKDTETLHDPKRKLIELALRGRSDLRRDLVAQDATARQGFRYNARLSEFAEQIWSPEDASENNRSLRRAMNALGRLRRALAL
jgi:hypothetical protein